MTSDLPRTNLPIPDHQRYSGPGAHALRIDARHAAAVRKGGVELPRRQHLRETNRGQKARSGPCCRSPAAGWRTTMFTVRGGESDLAGEAVPELGLWVRRRWNSSELSGAC